MGPIGGNLEDGVGDTHRVSETNHREAAMSEGGRDVGYSKGGGSAGSGGNPLVNDLHWKKTGGNGTVGGAAGIKKRYRI